MSEASALIPLVKAPRLRAELLRLFENSAIVRGTPFAKRIRGRWAEWQKLVRARSWSDRVAALGKDIKALLDRQADLQKKGENLSSADQIRLRDLNYQRDLGNFEIALRVYEANYVDMGRPKQPYGALLLGSSPMLVADLADRQRIRQFQNVISNWQKVLVEARDDQWVAVRATWPELPRCCVDGVDLVSDDISLTLRTRRRNTLWSTAWTS